MSTAATHAGTSRYGFSPFGPPSFVATLAGVFAAFLSWVDYDFPRPPRWWQLERSRLALTAWYVVEAAVAVVVIAVFVVLWLANAFGG